MKVAGDVIEVSDHLGYYSISVIFTRSFKVLLTYGFCGSILKKGV